MEENKVTTKESLKKLTEALQKEGFKKEFNKLFISYINIKNSDKNAHYHAILKLLTDTGMDKHEAEHVFKQLRVKNSELIQNIQEIQKKREELDRNWNDKKWKLLANPLDIKTFAQLALETINDINLAFKQMQQQMQLNNANNEIFGEKIDEIKKLIYDTEDDLKQLIEHDPENTFTLHTAVKNIQKIAEKAEELTMDVVTKNLENVEIMGQKGKEKEADNPQAPADKQTPAATETERSESPENDTLIEDDATPTEKESPESLTLEQALENSLHATLNSLNEKIDEKTLSFLTLSEYLHAYNNFPINQVYEKFKDVFDKDEFKAIVIYNNALMHNDTDDVFDFSIEEGFEAVNIGEYAKMLKHNFPEYKQLDKELEKELEEPQKEKELEIGAPQKNKKFTSIDIG